MGEEKKPAVSRRGLLRRAGTVAAGVGVAGAAGAVAANPAQAADGDNLVIGQANTGTAKTTLTSGASDTPALKLANNAANGVPLELQPVNLDVNGNTPVNAATVPVGSTYVDRWGDVHTVGDAQVNAGAHYDLMLYSPTWAFMPFPVAPARIVSTYPGSPGGRDLIVPGSANYDGAGRVLPKNSNSVPDAIIDLSVFVNGGMAAIQGNLSCGESLSDGWASLWDEGTWPGNSSINFPKTTWIANFTQTLIGSDLRIRVKVSAPTIIVFDLSGFVVTDWMSQLNFGGTGAAANVKGVAPAKPHRGIAPRR
jgi:hypothetical protein